MDQKTVKGFATGDMVKAIVTSGKKKGIYIGKVAVRKSGSFNIQTNSETFRVSPGSIANSYPSERG